MCPSHRSIIWPCQKIQSLEDFASWLLQIASRNRLIYRGQADSQWNLVPSIDRNTRGESNYEERLREEKELIQSFEDRARRFLGNMEESHFLHVDSDQVIRMTVMQHFGAPTRLLDWTESVAAAAYFACIDECPRDGTIWWVDESAIVRSVHPHWDAWGFNRYANLGGQVDLNDGIFNPEVARFICPVHLKIRFSRAQAQRALFTIGSRLGMAHDEQLKAQLSDNEYGVIIIPANLKGGVIEYLKRLGIDAVSLQHAGADRAALKMAWDRARKGAL